MYLHGHNVLPRDSVTMDKFWIDDLLDTSVQRVTALHSSLLHTH
jgi:Arc/MetJ family transcription regulator